ncbi:hypothetical protein [Desertibacillus haloalkaliphilus]|uniref:hypothetical protein n=1 Tax=Desertibacillus haloalkaliphilus TaxID=1328930 RepID=UPI001C278268|nr:hypothetical protein [Desertibacillus haloalkaliphilus]MBU8908108.1 hypothetical protein [Desertibacillus haloalkaliphilus]
MDLPVRSYNEAMERLEYLIRRHQTLSSQFETIEDVQVLDEVKAVEKEMQLITGGEPLDHIQQMVKEHFHS